MSGITNRIGPTIGVRRSLNSSGTCVSTSFVDCFDIIKRALTAKIPGFKLIHFISSSQPTYQAIVKAGELTDFVALFKITNPKKGISDLEEAEDQLAKAILNEISDALGEQFKSIELNVLPLPTAEEKERVAKIGWPTEKGHIEQINQLVVAIRTESSIRFPD